MTTTLEHKTRRRVGVAKSSRGTATNGSGESTRETREAVLVNDQQEHRKTMVWTSRYLALCDALWEAQPGEALHRALNKRITRAAGRRLA